MPRDGSNPTTPQASKTLSKTLTQADVFSQVQREFEALLAGLIPVGYYATRDVAKALTISGSTHTSLSKTSDHHERLPSRKWLLEALHAIPLEVWEARANAALQRHIGILPKGPVDVAIDTHKRPYHGKALLEFTRGGEAKDGTVHFHEYATLSILTEHRRLTIALHLLRPNESKTQVLEALLAEARKLGLRINHLDLDAWFSDSYVAEWCRSNLSLREMSVLTPLPKKGARAKRLLDTHRSKASWYEYHSPREGPDGETVEKVVRVPVHVIVIRAKGKRRGRKEGLEAHGFIVLGKRVSLRRTREHYHRRSRIEKTYAMLEQVVPRTTSDSMGLRFLLVLAGFIVQNAWTKLRWEKVSVPRRGRGGRRILVRAFEFVDFMRFIAQHAVIAFKAVSRVVTTWLKGRPETAEAVKA